MTDKEQKNWWVLHAQCGDREAIDELLKAVQEPLFRYIFSLAREKSVAEDVLQEVFIRIYRKLRWLRDNRPCRLLQSDAMKSGARMEVNISERVDLDGVRSEVLARIDMRRHRGCRSVICRREEDGVEVAPKQLNQEFSSKAKGDCARSASC